MRPSRKSSRAGEWQLEWPDWFVAYRLTSCLWGTCHSPELEKVESNADEFGTSGFRIVNESAMHEGWYSRGWRYG